MDVEVLKQKILDLAIRGKLVPQDPNDEPASALLEKIKAEKAKLVKEGKIKASKEESYIYKGSDNCYYEKIGNKTIDISDEIPFDIPDSWIWTRLKSVGDVIGGGTPSTSVKEYWDNGDIVWVTPAYMSSLESNYINDSYRKITKLGLDKSSAKLMPKGSIIMSSRAPIGYIAINTVEACTSQGCKSLVPYLIETNEFLLYVIKASITRIIEASKGTTFDEISGTKFGEILVPLAPLKEQFKICKLINDSYKTVNAISDDYTCVKDYISIAKRKILDSIFGPNSSYKSYYEKEYALDELLPYEQPGPYIVNSTDYNNSYKTPVITPGKSFILGYTNETDGVYSVGNSKIIIFDDFTTASRLIDFDFKVKSSAMKILKSSNPNNFNIDYLYYFLQTIYVNNDTHKRYWISEYAPLKFKIHTYDEQLKIIKYIKSAYDILDSINTF